MDDESYAPAIDEMAGLLTGAPEAADPQQNDDDSGLEMAAEILAGEDPAGEQEGAGEGAGEGPGDALPQDLASLAERLGVDPAALYDVAVPMADGEEPMTLGALKDAARELRQSEIDRLEWDTEATRQRNELSNAREELTQLAAMIPESMRTPEALAAARGEIERVQRAEARLALQRVPEWANPKVYEADQAEMAEHLEQFGFRADELGSVVDHRLLAYVRHNAKREQRIGKLLASAKAARESGAPRRGATQKATKPKPATARSASNSERVDAIAELLR